MAICCSASSSIVIASRPKPRSLFSRARRRMMTICSSFRPFNTKVRERDRRAEFTSKLGFSVVAPISVTTPRSTCGRTASCCALLKRCISSINRIVCCPENCFSFLASSTTFRRSATPAETALRVTKCAWVWRAITSASVVLPLPGGPHKIIEGIRSSSMLRRSTRPGAKRCSCPRISSSVRGRMRAASGSPIDIFFVATTGVSDPKRDD